MYTSNVIPNLNKFKIGCCLHGEGFLSYDSIMHCGASFTEHIKHQSTTVDRQIDVGTEHIAVHSPIPRCVCLLMRADVDMLVLRLTSSDRAITASAPTLRHVITLPSANKSVVVAIITTIALYK